MSGRYPGMGNVIMYGAPGVGDWHPIPGQVEVQPVPVVGTWPWPLSTTPSAEDIAKAIREQLEQAPKKCLRISTAHEGGGLRVKVTLDGVMISESFTPGNALVVESDV